MAHTHPLNYYLVYCPISMVLHWVGRMREEKLLRHEERGRCLQ